MQGQRLGLAALQRPVLVQRAKHRDQGRRLSVGAQLEDGPVRERAADAGERVVPAAQLGLGRREGFERSHVLGPDPCDRLGQGERLVCAAQRRLRAGREQEGELRGRIRA